MGASFLSANERVRRAHLLAGDVAVELLEGATLLDPMDAESADVAFEELEDDLLRVWEPL